MDGARSFERYIGFASQFAPILVAHALMPTLGSAYGREFRSVISLPLKRRVLETHFVFSRSALRKGRWWTTFSYMFLHVDHAHAMANFQGLVLTGPSALDVCGPLGAAAAYLAAGVVAALDPPRLRDYQLEQGFRQSWSSAASTVERSFRRLFDLLDLDPTFLEPPESALRRRRTPVVFRGPTDALESVSNAVRHTLDLGAEAIDGAADRLTKAVAKESARSRRLVGASAGVAAFMAIDLCVSLERLLRGDDVGDAPLVVLLHVLGALKYFAGELNRTRTGHGLEGVDHAAHLNGALVGVAAFVLGRALRGRARGATRRPARRSHSAAI